jgi:hypothetical protein
MRLTPSFEVLEKCRSCQIVSSRSKDAEECFSLGVWPYCYVGSLGAVFEVLASTGMAALAKVYIGGFTAPSFCSTTYLVPYFMPRVLG